jgi:hypothetical protein
MSKKWHNSFNYERPHDVIKVIKIKSEDSLDVHTFNDSYLDEDVIELQSMTPILEMMLLNFHR